SAAWACIATASRRWNRRSCACACSPTPTLRNGPNPSPASMARPEAGGAGLEGILADWRRRTDTTLAAALDALDGHTEPRLLAAMRHAVLLGGKRMRPLLAY